MLLSDVSNIFVMGKVNGVNLICSIIIDIVKEVEIELADFSALTKNVRSLFVGLR